LKADVLKYVIIICCIRKCPELQSEIPAQGGKYDTNRIKYKGESDDTKAGGAERFFLFYVEAKQPAGKGERRWQSF